MHLLNLKTLLPVLMLDTGGSAIKDLIMNGWLLLLRKISRICSRHVPNVFIKDGARWLGVGIDIVRNTAGSKVIGPGIIKRFRSEGIVSPQKLQ